jgi:hypothetical protein
MISGMNYRPFRQATCLIIVCVSLRNEDREPVYRHLEMSTWHFTFSIRIENSSSTVFIWIISVKKVSLIITVCQYIKL